MKRKIAFAAVLAAGCSSGPSGFEDHAAAHSDGGELSGPVKVTTPPMVRIREFHGHLGPYVVLGYRMGLAARKALSSPGYFDLKADVSSPLVPPASCLVDGLQLGSGCTTGKGNLTVKEGPIARVVFQTKAGKTATLALRAEIPEQVRARIEEVGVERAALEIIQKSDDDLFVVEGP